MKNKRVPEIRFIGFNGEWVERKLGEVSTFINGRAYKQHELLYSGEYKVLRVGNFYTNDSWYFSNLELDDKYYAVSGDLLYTWSATFGPHIWYGDKVIYHYHIWKVELSDKLNKQFLLQLLEYDKAQITSDKNGSTLVHITKKGMEEKKVLFPMIDEQTKVGNFFKQLDESIALHQKELTSYRQTKQGFLQKMFPKGGESVPEIRFPGFTGDWALRKISEIGNISVGGDVDKEKLIEVGKYPVLANSLSNDGIVGYYNNYKSVAPAVTITGRGDVGHAKARHINFTAVVRLLVLKPSDGFNVDFLESAINNIDIWVESTGVPQLTAPQLGNYNVYIPSNEEQAQIGNFFKQLDDLIALHQRELEALEETKKAFLQKMFV